MMSRNNMNAHTLSVIKQRDPGAGKSTLTHAEFLKMTNLYERKAEVLRIATENYRLAQRLAGVRSSIGQEQNKKGHSLTRMRPRTSFDYTNSDQKYHGPN